MSRPNVVFLMCDDRRYDTIHALGNAHIHTPHTDWLVEHGTAFTNALNPGGTCAAVCMPSRAMMHTGRTLFHIAGDGQEIPTDHVMIGEALRASGYETHGIGKWHNGTGSFNRAFSSGDEIFFGGMADHWNVPLFRYDPSGEYAGRCRYAPEPFTSNEVETHFGDHIHAGRHSTDLFGDAAARFLDSYNSDAPYFLYVSFMAPHDPRTMPDEYRAMYDADEMGLPPNFQPVHPFDNGEMDVRDEKLASRPREPGEIRRHIAEYYAMISHMDAQFGRIIEAVRTRGELANTVFVHCADHGLALGQHGLMGKQNLYEHSVRVPMILSGPGIACGTRDDSPVCLRDLFPTLCSLTETPVPSSVEGRSAFVPRLREAELLAYRDIQRGLRTERWKLIEYAVSGQPRRAQLFDLLADPWEERDLAFDNGHRATLTRLRAELDRLMREANDPQREKFGQ